MVLTILMVVVGIACLVICYKMTDSAIATTIYGFYIALIIITVSLSALTTQ